MDGIAVAPVYQIQQIIAIPVTTVMAVQRKRTGSHAQQGTNALVVTNLSNVLLASTRTNLPNMIVNHANLVIIARIYLFRTIRVTNVLLGSIVRGRRSLTHNFLALVESLII